MFPPPNPWSFDAVSENRKINRTLNVTPVLGDGDSIPVISYDIILANIQKNVILIDMDKYSKVLKDRGNILLSGFFTEDVPDILAKASNCNLTSVGILSKNNWVVVILQKNKGNPLTLKISFSFKIPVYWFNIPFC
jgi:ribosomal protein L11 methyltransferase